VQPANVLGDFWNRTPVRCRFALKFPLGRLPTIRVVS
jgi:hypothetical protein